MFSWLKRKRRKTQEDFDFLPLFFWDKGLSDTAKILMCIIGGGKTHRKRTLSQLTQKFPAQLVESIHDAIEELEFYGYISNEAYKGDYGEQRIDRRVCICPQNRLPPIVEPSGGLPEFAATSMDMFDLARRLGFISEVGKDTTYFLYNAMRMFSIVERALTLGERVVLPQVGTETIREDTPGSKLREYPHAVAGIIITTQRVIIIQEDADPQGRQAGLARLLSLEFKDIEAVLLDERRGAVTFRIKPTVYGPRSSVCMDIMTALAVDNYKQYYEAALALLETHITMPPLVYEREATL